MTGGDASRTRRKLVRSGVGSPPAHPATVPRHPNSRSVTPSVRWQGHAVTYPGSNDAILISFSFSSNRV
jgi:hypothetical protein